jgi:hypothetical protein
MRFRGVLLFVFVGSLVIARERPAHAEPPAATSEAQATSEGDQLIERGLKLREQGRDADALPLFERANALEPSPRACAQLALANQALGKWVEAERGLMTALDAADDAWVMQRREPLEKALATVRSQLGWLEVEANVPGAAISVDESLVGVAPLAGPLRVAGGLVHLKVTASGYLPALRLVQVRSGEHAHEVLTLQPEHASSPEEGRPTEASPAPVATVRSDTSGAASRAKVGRTRTSAWLALGGSATLLAGGAIASAIREHDVSIWNDNAKCLVGTATREQTCSQYQSAANTATVLSVIGYATGGALALTSLVLFLRSAPEPVTGAHALGPRCGIDVTMAWCAGAF